MLRLNGGLIGVTNKPGPIGVGDTFGVWSLEEQAIYARQGLWLPNKDPHLSNVSFLMQPDGTDGSTTFTDSSSNNITITANGTAQNSNVQARFGTTSARFTTNGDYLSMSNASNFITFGSSNFTVEVWAYLPTPTTNPAWGERALVGLWSATNPSAQAWLLWISGSNIIFIADVVVNDNYVINVPHGITTEKWTHFAVVRNGQTITVYVDGVAVGAGGVGTSSITTGANTVGIGGYNRGTGGNATLNGYIDGVRITKNVARYTSNFSVPRVPFPLV